LPPGEDAGEKEVGEGYRTDVRKSSLLLYVVETRRPGLLRPGLDDYFFFAAFLTFFTAFFTAFLTFFLAAIVITSFF
jgi:hypothetical protein